MTVLTPIAGLLVIIELIAKTLGPVSRPVELLLLIIAGVLFLWDILRPLTR